MLAVTWVGMTARLSWKIGMDPGRVVGGAYVIQVASDTPPGTCLGCGCIREGLSRPVSWKVLLPPDTRIAKSVWTV